MCLRVSSAMVRAPLIRSAQGIKGRYTQKFARRLFRCWCAKDQDYRKSAFVLREKIGTGDKQVLADYPELLEQTKANDTLMHMSGIPLSVELLGKGQDDLIGYRAKKHTGVVDMDAPNSCEVLDYWEPIHSRGKRHLILDPDEFYILASKESVHVPPEYAAEMVPFNPLVGEFRVHYAGFFDPGFGHSSSGGSGSKGVLEVRSHKVPFILEDGQIIGHLIYEHLSEAPRQLYGTDIGSHYQAQGLKLSKHFYSK